MTAKNPRPLTQAEEIPCCENCGRYSERKHPAFEGNIICYCGNERMQVETKVITKRIGCLSHPVARAYLNKDVIKTLEWWINGLECPKCPPGDAYARVIALLRGDGK